MYQNPPLKPGSPASLISSLLPRRRPEMFCRGNHFFWRQVNWIKIGKMIDGGIHFRMLFLLVSKTNGHFSVPFQSNLNIRPVAALLSAHQSPNFPPRPGENFLAKKRAVPVISPANGSIAYSV